MLQATHPATWRFRIRVRCHWAKQLGRQFSTGTSSWEVVNSPSWSRPCPGVSWCRRAARRRIHSQWALRWGCWSEAEGPSWGRTGSYIRMEFPSARHFSSDAAPGWLCWGCACSYGSFHLDSLFNFFLIFRNHKKDTAVICTWSFVGHESACAHKSPSLWLARDVSLAKNCAVANTLRRWNLRVRGFTIKNCTKI